MASTAAKEIRGTLAAGSRLRSYQLVSVIGQGAFGITYRARDTTLHRDVAIKEYLPTSLALRESDSTVVPRSTEQAAEFVWGRERFLDEARTLARFSDVPAIVRVYDFLEANGTGYMVMALVQGDTLERRLREDGTLSPTQVERILGPLLDGLERVHEAGFLHRDIKPANIMLDARGNPTLVDFGAARAAMAGRSTALTAIFTPGYAAVEQFTGDRQGPWTDIYGLAATLHHAITGEQPPSAVNRVLDDTRQPLVELGLRGWPRGLLAGIDAGLAVRIGERPQSIAEWRVLLSATGESDRATVAMARPRPAVRPVEPAAAPVPVPVLGPAPAPPPARTSRRLVPAAVAALAVAALAAGAWFAFAPKPQPTVAELQSLKAEDLERLLAERRAADAAAAEKKRLEEEAQRKAEADAAAKQQADADLEKARQDRLKAEADLAKLKADMEARRQADEQGQRQVAEAAARRAAEEEAQRKAEAEMAALRKTEQDAQRKAALEAENKRKADEALARAQAERRKADAEAREKEAAEKRRKEEAEALAAIRQYEAEQKKIAEQKKADEQRKAEEEKARAEARRREEAEALAAIQKLEADQKKAAETAEAGLGLSQADRQRLQVALTSLGFDTRATDGNFGARTREMIAGWQKARNQLVTGYLSRPQQQAILHQAAAALEKYDAEQKRLADQKKADEQKAKAEAEKKAAAATPAPRDQTQAALDGLLTGKSHDGVYRNEGSRCFPVGNFRFGDMGVTNGRLTVTWNLGIGYPRCSIPIQPDGTFNDPKCALGMSGKFAGNKLTFSVKGESMLCEGAYVKK